MKEAQKTKKVRSADFYSSFMSGRVLDIGAGDDLCVSHVQPFDKEQGDANHILDYLKPATFDAVHSSHALEHMRDPVWCLSDWWALVKPGGFLITVVPDEDLYEQGLWPSLFNSDHKNTFRIKGASSWSPVSRDIVDLIGALPGVEIISVERHDLFRVNQRYVVLLPEPFRRIFGRIFLKFLSFPLFKNDALRMFVIRGALLFDVPVDQTLHGALAQIQVVARKVLR
jgi:SAM-dependent methyltransferase